MDQKKVSPFRIIRIKPPEEGRAKYTLMIKKSTQRNKICIKILDFID